MTSARQGEDERREALLDVAKLRIPLAEAVLSLREFPWDWLGDPLATLTIDDVLHALDAYLGSSIDADDLQYWARSVDSRDDLDLTPEDAELIRQVLLEMSAPRINTTIDQSQAQSWKTQVAGDAETN